MRIDRQEFDSISYCGNLTWLRARTILFTRHGSHAYGLNTPSSDLDFKGVAIPPDEYLLGLGRFEQTEFKDPEQNAEAVIYDLRKFCRLAAECNPNIIEVLWADPSDYLSLQPAGASLVAHRNMFLSKKVRHTFCGYAFAQLKRIKLHHAWNQYGHSKKEPTRKDYNLPERTLIPADQLAAARADIQKQLDRWNLTELEALEPAARIQVLNSVSSIVSEMKVGLDDSLWVGAARMLGYDTNFIELLDQERRYTAARREWASFLEWKKNRNPQRAALEEKFGYDCKHAVHLVRLMKMCGEILDTGKVIVKRPDRDELLEIRNGAWPYEKLLEFAETEDRNMQDKYDRSTLPKGVDMAAVSELCVRLSRGALCQ